MKYLVIALFMILASDCKNQKKTQENSNQETSETSIAGAWKITMITNNDLSQNDEAKITLDLAENKMQATIGCNRHMGGFTVKNKSITISNLISTEMYCPDLAKLEIVFQEQLKKTTQYQFDNESLILQDENGNTTFILNR